MNVVINVSIRALALIFINFRFRETSSLGKYYSQKTLQFDSSS